VGRCVIHLASCVCKGVTGAATPTACRLTQLWLCCDRSYRFGVQAHNRHGAYLVILPTTLDSTVGGFCLCCCSSSVGSPGQLVRSNDSSSHATPDSTHSAPRPPSSKVYGPGVPQVGPLSAAAALSLLFHGQQQPATAVHATVMQPQLLLGCSTL
jgi:hypothetical protein